MPDKGITTGPRRAVNHGHGKDLLHSLNKQRIEAHSTCDLRIFSRDGKEFTAHKAITAAACPYFDGLISSSFVESKNAKVQLPFSTEVVSIILEYIYSGMIHLRDDIVLEILYAADFLMIDFLKGPVVNYICADVKRAFSEKNIASIGLDASLVVFSILKYYIEDEDILGVLAELLVSCEAADFAEVDDICNTEVQHLNVPQPVVQDTSSSSSSTTNAFRFFSNKLYKFDGFGWSRVFCPEFNEKAPSLKSFAVVDENGKFLYQTQEELRLFEVENGFCEVRSLVDKSLKPFHEAIISIQSNRLCFSENTIMAMFTQPQQIEPQLHLWNDISQSFQTLGDIWPLSVTYLDYIFEDSLQGKSRLFVVGNFKTLNGDSIANSIFSFNLCPITGIMLCFQSLPVLPYINNSYIYHHFKGKLVAIPRTIGRNFCKDFYVFDETSASWLLWEEAKLKVENRTILDVVSTRDSLYLIMSSFDHRWQNEFVQWNGREFTDVTFSTSIPIEGKLLERISWIDYNIVNKVLQKARGLWL